jgi:hypothetical protein
MIEDSPTEKPDWFKNPSLGFVHVWDGKLYSVAAWKRGRTEVEDRAEAKKALNDLLSLHWRKK